MSSGLGKERFISMPHWCAAGAKSIIEAQMRLDERARDSLLAWERDGMPPSAWTWTSCTLKLPVAFRAFAAVPGGSNKSNVGVAVATRPERSAGCGKLSVTFLYVEPAYAEEAANDGR